jgi:GNAT superfamily N-acetyltransferase
LISSIEPFDAIRRISPGIDLSSFDCGNPDFDDFARNEAFQDQQNGYSITYAGMMAGTPVAFVTLVAAAYRAENLFKAGNGDYRYRHIPAIKIARLATNLTCQRKGCGRALVDFSFAKALNIMEQIGCKLLVTDALPGKVEWYRKRGFSLSVDVKRTRPGRENYPMHAILH